MANTPPVPTNPRRCSRYSRTPALSGPTCRNASRSIVMPSYAWPPKVFAAYLLAASKSLAYRSSSAFWGSPAGSLPATSSLPAGNTTPSAAGPASWMNARLAMPWDSRMGTGIPSWRMFLAAIAAVGGDAERGAGRHGHERDLRRHRVVGHGLRLRARRPAHHGGHAVLGHRFLH